MWLTLAVVRDYNSATNMPIIRQNLHNHSTHSDGRHSLTDIVEAASKANLEGIGFSDHFFTNKVFHDLTYEIYLETKWPAYLEETARLKKAAPVNLKIWAGIEIDSCLDRVGAEIDQLPWNEINTLDYVLIEYVAEDDSGGMSIKELGNIRHYCTAPIIIAHPHIEKISKGINLDTFCLLLKKYKVAMELPAGTRNPWFWESFDPACLRGLSLTIGTDTHQELSEVGNIEKVLSFLEKSGLKNRIADPDSLKASSGGR